MSPLVAPLTAFFFVCSVLGEGTAYFCLLKNCPQLQDSKREPQEEPQADPPVRICRDHLSRAQPRPLIGPKKPTTALTCIITVSPSAIVIYSPMVPPEALQSVSREGTSVLPGL